MVIISPTFSKNIYKGFYDDTISHTMVVLFFVNGNLCFTQHILNKHTILHTGTFWIE